MEKEIKLCVLYSRLSGYMAACLQAYKTMYRAKTLIYCKPVSSEAPFDEEAFRNLGEVKSREGQSNEEILREIELFRPDVVLVSGWADKGYRKICRKLKESGVLIVAGCDNQWTGSFRQRIGGIVSPWHLKLFIDVLWVAGERQRKLAEALGYRGRQCWEGIYSCDTEAFSGVKVERSWLKAQEPESQPSASNATLPPGSQVPALSPHLSAPPCFLYVGRYVPAKGLDVLSDAYQIYRRSVSDPWPLRCVGRGPCQHFLAQMGAEDLGFIQPDALPTAMAQASAFILPSRHEPWGVVLHEACTIGLPIVASTAVGAAAHLLRDGFNGYRFANEDPEDLADALIRVHRLGAEERLQMGEHSRLLASQYSPRLWADTLACGLEKWKRMNATQLKDE